MSTAKFDTLQNAAGTKSVPVSTVVDGSAKAWVNFNGTGVVAIRAAFNVSSITDNGVGNYSLTFTSSMPDTNYAVLGQVRRNADSQLVHQLALWASDAKLTSSVQVRSSDGNTGGLSDMPEINVAIFR